MSNVVYREGATASGSIYAHFSDAVDAINASGVPSILYVDGSLSQPVVPAGTYNNTLVALAEFPGQVNVSLNLLDGAKLNPAPSLIDGGLSLYSYSSQPIIDQANLTLTIQNGSWLQTAGTAEFIHVGSGAVAQIFLSETSYLAGSVAGSTAPIISSDADSTFTGINISNWCDVGQGALDGYGAMEANLISTSATIEAQSTAYNLTVVNANPVGGDISGTTASATAVALQGRAVNSFSPTDGYVLTWDNHDGYWVARPTTTTYTGLRQAYFTSSGTWTAPAGVTNVLVIAAGGGAGGAGGSTNGGGFGGPGGGGSLQQTTTVSVVPGNNYIITIGSGSGGGTPGTPGSGSGDGGSTTFGSLFTALGGGGAFSNGGGWNMAGASTANNNEYGPVYGPGYGASNGFSSTRNGSYNGGTNGTVNGGYPGGYGAGAGPQGNGGNGGNGNGSGTGSNGGSGAANTGAGGGGGGAGSTGAGHGGSGGSGYLYVIY